jgi:tetratricopeptide (TPR) repeat protein/TolB-like protein
MEDRRLLRSWKEIATHLNCSLRTCHRWEEDLDLPIHRLDGTPKARVFAYIDEIDSWMEDKLHSREVASEELHKSKRRRELLLAGLFGAVAAFSLLAWRLSVSKPAPPPAIKPVLAVLPFENLSGTEDLDWLGTGLAELITTDLFQSRYLEILSGDKVYGVLKGLKIAQSRKFSQEDLARIAKGVNADHVGFGSFMKTGENIIITFNLQQMPEGKLISSRKVICEGQAGIGDGIDELGRQIKADIGLDPRQVATDMDEKTGRITTRNPEALKLFLEALGSQRAVEESRALLTKAIEIDPEFAMAYRSLGILQTPSREAVDGEEPRAEWAKNLKRALELSDRVSTRERYIIQATYFERVKKDGDKTLQAYKKLLELYPDDYQGNFAISRIFQARGDYANALKYREFLYRKDRNSRALTMGVADLYLKVGAPEKAFEVYRYYLANQWPHDIQMRWVFYEALWRSGAFDLALEEADTTERLDPTEEVERIYPYYLMGNYPAAEKVCENTLKDKPLKSHWLARDWLQNIYVTQGQFEKAKEQIALGLQELDSISEAEPGRSGERTPDQGKIFLLRRRARISCVEGDLDRALIDIDSILEDYQRREDDAKDKRSRPTPLWEDLMTKVEILLEMGRSDEALDTARMIADLVSARALEWRRRIATLSGAENAIRIEKSHLDLIQGRIELKRGRLSKAIDLLKSAQFPSIDATHPSIPLCYYMEALALAYEQAGKLPQAREEYEKLLRLTGGRLLEGYAYAMSLYRLGKVCEGQGDRAKAIEYNGKFVELWKNADRTRPELEDARTRLAGLMSRQPDQTRHPTG